MSFQKGSQQGFSLLELLVVVAIIAVIAALAVPSLTAAMQGYRLDMSGHAVASLLVQARLQAVRNNVPAYVQYDGSHTPNIAFINGDPSTTTFVLGNPDVEVATATFTTTNLPDHAQLQAYLSNGNQGVTEEIGGAIGFNARGLPCMETAAANPVLCWQQDPNTTNTPYFEWFMQDGKGGWEAVTVTPAGRVKAWRKTNTTGCGYQVCWQ